MMSFICHDSSTKLWKTSIFHKGKKCRCDTEKDGFNKWLTCNRVTSHWAHLLLFYTRKQEIYYPNWMQVQQMDLILYDCHVIVLSVEYFAFTADLSQIQCPKDWFCHMDPKIWALRFCTVNFVVKSCFSKINQLSSEGCLHTLSWYCNNFCLVQRWIFL